MFLSHIYVFLLPFLSLKIVFFFKKKHVHIQTNNRDAWKMETRNANKGTWGLGKTTLKLNLDLRVRFGWGLGEME